MLGGSVYIAILRFAISLVGTSLLFFLISEPRYERRKAVVCYAVFCIAALIPASIWYVMDWENCVRMVAFLLYVCFVVFSICMSSDPIYLSVYKLALIYYLLAVFLIGGIEVAMIFFDGNVWADIITRIVLISFMAFFIKNKLQDSIKAFGIYVENELDRFSAVIMTMSLLWGISFILNPNQLELEQTPYRLLQIMINFFLTGSLQFLVFRLYLHIGREQEYQKENQLMQMNHRLLERQMELLEESVEASRRIRHDARHHNAVIAEYARQGQIGELLLYMVEAICENTAVNNILSAYTRKARKAQIKVTLDVELDKELAIPNIDLVTILSNAYENAIFGCMEVKKHMEERECFIHLLIKRKKRKLVICCSNTCRKETELKKGQPKPEFTGGIGVSSIIKTAQAYGGEYDEGVFIFRLIMNIPARKGTGYVSDSTL